MEFHRNDTESGKAADLTGAEMPLFFFGPQAHIKESLRVRETDRLCAQTAYNKNLILQYGRSAGRAGPEGEEYTVKKKWNTLAVCSFVIALAIFVFTYFLFHHMSADGGFVDEYYELPEKPFVTLLFGVWGVMFLFSSVMSLVVGKIFFSEK